MQITKVSEFPSFVQSRKQTGIVVRGHTRARHLGSLLESLRRQQNGRDVHVWLDGHSGRKHLIPKVKECRQMVKQKFPEMQLTTINGNIGNEKLTIDCLDFMSRHYERIIVLEDDCFPIRSALDVFEAELDAVSSQPEIFSVYGHHFLVPAEGETITRFQGWGWATTTEKLLSLLPELKKCFAMSEPDYLRWVKACLTPNMKALLDVTPGRNCIEVMTSFFSQDSCLCLMTAQRGLLHKKTSKRVIYNCGLGEGGEHFSYAEIYRQPPFNMITVDEVWDYFDDTVASGGASDDGEANINLGSQENTDPDSLNQRGEMLFAKGDLQGAYQAFTEALEADSASATAHNNLGVLHWQSGEADRAIAHFEEALKIHSDDRHCILNYAEVLKYSGRTDDAMKLYSSYLRRHPDDPEILRCLNTMVSEGAAGVA